jgi:3-hydroxyacyl-[acyl-carrier-protein] dehydratase
MAADAETRKRILGAVPQQAPFRFIDEIISLDETRITGAYRFREDEFFYRGHFPGHPITPGVILIETMAQSGIVALGIYILMVEKGLKLEEMSKILTLFSYVEGAEFLNPVFPGDRVIVHGEKIYYRKGNIKAKVSVEHEDGRPVCSGILAGIEQAR